MADDEVTATDEGLDGFGGHRSAGSGAGLGKGLDGPLGPRSNGAAPPSAAAYEHSEDQAVGDLPGLEGLARRPPAPAVKGPSGWIYHSTSLFCLPPHNPFRRLIIHFIEAWFFEPFIGLTIAANICTMAWTSPLDEPNTAKADIIASCEQVYLGIFTTEMVAKIIAYGFAMHSNSYLRDAWCQLDFVVVSLAWLPYVIPSFGNFTMLRTLRALRPLRTLRFVPGMPTLISSIFKSIPPLGSVAGLCAFLFLIFGIVGEELFEGSLHWYCIKPSELWALEHGGHHRLLKGGGGGGEKVPFCRAGDASLCHEGEICHYFEDNPPGQSAHFDSVIAAAMAIIQVITFDTWSNVMYDLMRAFSNYVWVYFFLVAMLGGFFVVNLFLAVVFDEFMRSKEVNNVLEDLEKRKQEVEEAEQQMNDKMQAAGGMMGIGDQENGHYATITGNGGPEKSLPQGVPFLRPIVESEPFTFFTIFLLVGNTVIMCLPYAGMSTEYAEQLDVASRVFTYLFTLEVGLKFIGIGYKDFVAEGWNLFDSSLLAVSLLDIFLSALKHQESNLNVSYFRVLRMLRMVRVLRMLRMMRYWEGLFRIFTCLLGAAQQVANIFVLLFIFMTMFTLLGMQMFGGKCGSDESRFHFDYYVPGMLTVLSTFSGGWVDPFVACSAGGLTLARVYFTVALVIGFFVIFNLFIAILLDSFATEDEEEEAEGEEGAGDDNGAEKEYARVSLSEGKSVSFSQNQEEEESQVLQALREKELSESDCRRFCYSVVTHPTWETFIIVAILVSSVALVLDEPRLDRTSKLAKVLETSNYAFTALFVLELVLKVAAFDLFAKPDGYLLSSWNVLDVIIVFVSIVSLCPEFGRLSFLRLLRVLRPLRLLSRIEGMKVIFEFFYRASGDIANVTGVVIFFQTSFAVLGMELFMDSFGSCTDPSITIREDCIPIEERHGRALAMASQVHPTGDIPKLPPVWVGPDRGDVALSANWTSHFDGKTTNLTSFPPVPLTLARSAPPLTSTADGHVSYVWRHGRKLKGGGGRGNANANADGPVQWLNPPFGSFDDFISAMLILFIASTGDGWEDFMFRGMDSVGPGIAPVRNDFSPSAFYFIMWLMVGTFTTINLFVGSVVDNFTKIKADIEGSATLTKEQKQWQRTMQESMNSKKAPPPPPTRPPSNPMLRPFFLLVTSQPFDLFITVVILSNIMVMALDYHKIEEDPWNYAFYTNGLQAFGYIYYGECVLKLLGLGCSGYFRDNWNRFDFFLVMTSLLDEFASEQLATVLPIPPMLLRVLRVARIMRIMRLLKGFKGLRDLLMTMVLSFPSFVNVGGLLFLVTFIYAVLGVQLFTFVKEGEEMNEQRNFDNFGNAYLLLLQCLTGDNWSGLMYDAMVGPERGCDPDAIPTDCGNILAIPFFVSYTIFGAFILLNLVVAVILENFTALGDLRPDLVSAGDISEFGELWADYDDNMNGKLTEEQLAELLLKVPLPLGFAESPTYTEWDSDPTQKLYVIREYGESLNCVRSLKIRDQFDGQCHFEKTVDALIQRNYSVQEVDLPPEIVEPPAMKRTNSASGKPALQRVFSTGHGLQPGKTSETVAVDAFKAIAAAHKQDVATSPFIGSQNGTHAAVEAVPALSSTGTTMAPMKASPVVVTPAPNWSIERRPYGDTPSSAARSVMPQEAVRRPTPPRSAERVALPDPARLPAPSPLSMSPPANGTPHIAPPRPPPGMAPPLPPGWYVATGPHSIYYYNVETRQVSWQPPIEWLRGERRKRKSPNGLSSGSMGRDGENGRRKGWDA